MKRPSAKISTALAVAGLCLILTGCKLFDMTNLPALKYCGLDAAMEAWNVYTSEKPTVEASLDRVNTAARMLDLGGLMLHSLPISAGSEWPRQVKGSVPFTEKGNLEQMMRNDPVKYGSYGASATQSSALKVKALYLQSRLFSTYPDLYYEPTFRSKPPTEAEVNALGTKLLGPSYPPAFTKVLYHLLLFNPAFQPKRELFEGRFNGKPAEMYPNVMDAVLSLADDKKELEQLRESMLQVEEKKAKERRDIEETAQRIRQLQSQDAGKPSTAEEAAQRSEPGAHRNEIEELKQQLEIQEKEFEESVKAYKEELTKLSIELAKIKDQSTAFTPEQQALAANVQATVEAVQGSLCDESVLLFIAGQQFYKALPNVKQELRDLFLTQGQTANKRIERVSANLATLPTNLKMFTTELGVQGDDAKAYDGLFKSRLSAQSVNGR